MDCFLSLPVEQSPTAPPIVLQTTFTNHVSKCKDPPRYEDAVKQTRSMITAVQVSKESDNEVYCLELIL